VRYRTDDILLRDYVVWGLANARASQSGLLAVMRVWSPAKDHASARSTVGSAGAETQGNL